MSIRRNILLSDSCCQISSKLECSNIMIMGSVCVESCMYSVRSGIMFSTQKLNGTGFVANSFKDR